MTTFTTEDRKDAQKTVATITIEAFGDEVNVNTTGDGQALFIANLMVQLVDEKVKASQA
jgi:hypothetical protein